MSLRYRALWNISILLCLTMCMSEARALLPEKPLPLLHDGITVTGPGTYHYDGTLRIEGSVVLRNLELDIRGPIVVAAGAHLELDRVRLKVSDEPNAPNGTSGLRCLGPTTILIHSSSMKPVGTAHPMWLIEGFLDLNGFKALDSEFHLNHTMAKLNRLQIFELEVSRESHVTAEDMNLVFLSTHTADNESVKFSNIPTGEAFSRDLLLGSGAVANVKNTRTQFFLVYVHGQSGVSMANMGRVQIAIFPACRGVMVLPSGMLGTAQRPAIFPGPHASDCPFRISLQNVNVDSWDVYASGRADLNFTNSVIDELVASSHSRIAVRKSNLYADWLSVSDHGHVSVTDSIIGALRLSTERPDLATSQVRLSDWSQAVFLRDRFDCGIFISDHAEARIIAPVVPPLYHHELGSGRMIYELSSTTR